MVELSHVHHSRYVDVYINELIIPRPPHAGYYDWIQNPDSSNVSHARKMRFLSTRSVSLFCLVFIKSKQCRYTGDIGDLFNCEQCPLRCRAVQGTGVPLNRDLDTAMAFRGQRSICRARISTGRAFFNVPSGVKHKRSKEQDIRTENPCRGSTVSSWSGNLHIMCKSSRI